MEIAEKLHVAHFAPSPCPGSWSAYERPSRDRSGKLRWPWGLAYRVARELGNALAEVCEPYRCQLVGSLRRGRSMVGDIEILYVGRIGEVLDTESLFHEPIETDLSSVWIDGLIQSGVLAKRESRTGTKMYGPKNKLLVHVSSGIPLDLFSATEESWFNLLVCRTGSKSNNIRIASAARSLGLRWNPYGVGFTDPGGHPLIVRSERDVFEHVGLDYLEPESR